MSIKYGSLNVDERYSGILEPNLYYNPVLVPGVTCTDKYQIGPAGQIYVHKLTTSAVESGTPGRDFSDTAVSDTLIPIQLNNNFQRSYTARVKSDREYTALPSDIKQMISGVAQKLALGGGNENGG